MALVLRPLSLGEMMDRTFSLYRDHFKLFVGIFVVPQIATFAVSFGMQVISQSATSSSATAPIAAVSVLLYLPIFLAVILATYALSQAATVYAVSQVYLERPTTISQSYSFIKGRFWSILAVIVLVFLAAMVGAMVGVIALLIGAIVIPVLIVLYSSLAVPVTVLEGRDPIESIKRSYNLVKDDLGRIFVVWLLFTVIRTAASYLVAIPTFVLTIMFQRHGQVPLWFSAVSGLAGLIVGSIVGPLLTIALSIAYYDERVRKEAFDMQFMMAAIDHSTISTADSSLVPPSV
ncbi:MAG TPA: hypothetical protein VK738_06495 [Terriglobales bacterium]|nr:hypothetical protein [Terriglobales bacterium]